MGHSGSDGGQTGVRRCAPRAESRACPSRRARPPRAHSRPPRSWRRAGWSAPCASYWGHIGVTLG
eukprot:3752763-Prymnesium_polylepis.1